MEKEAEGGVWPSPKRLKYQNVFYIKCDVCRILVLFAHGRLSLNKKEGVEKEEEEEETLPKDTTKEEEEEEGRRRPTDFQKFN